MSNFSNRLLSINEFCAFSGIGRTKVYQELSSGRLSAIKIGRRTLIPTASIAGWLNSQKSFCPDFASFNSGQEA